MITPAGARVESADGPPTRQRHTAAYIACLAVVMVVAGGYSLRRDGIFACGAEGYGADRYLSYCQATSYGDYDYGAFWFGLEPEAQRAAASADVVILGNSRTQIGLSSEATAAWFADQQRSYYMLGFSHNGNVNFEGPLLTRLGSRPRAYIINLDLFFEPFQTPPARTVMQDEGARTRYREKRLWQQLHRPVCRALPWVCADEPAFYRSRATGSWVEAGGRFTAKPAAYDSIPDQGMVRRYTQAAEEFLNRLAVPRECVLFTVVPTARTPLGTARAVSAALGQPLVAPQLDSLMTYDGSHLDRESAERWSLAFFTSAGPHLRHCLGARAAGARS